MVVDVSADGLPGAPRELLTAEQSGTGVARGWDVDAQGRLYFVSAPEPYSERVTKLRLVLNWEPAAAAMLPTEQ